MFEENNEAFDSQDVDADKTADTNEDANTLDGIPDEDAKLGDEDQGDSKKPDRSEVAQKIRYREKFNKSQEKIRDLEAKLQAKEKAGGETQEEEKELAAQRYIRKQAREEFEALMLEEKNKKEEQEELFQDKLDEVLDANPDLTESQILDICEEFKVEPEVAAKILQRVGKPKAKRTSLPNSKRGSAEVTDSDSGEDKDKNKTLFEIAQEVKRSLTKK